MFETLHEENLWFAINKPIGVSVHNPEDRSVIAQYLEQNDPVSPVHRLDKETSGILLLSRDSAMTTKLQKSLASSTKKYICVCRKPFSKSEGEWIFPISEKAQGFKNPQGKKKEQKESKSTWKILQENSYLSMVEVTIETGRTHQIRRHAALSGHHIVGDSRYGARKFNQKMSAIYKCDRMFLHAAELNLIFGNREIQISSEVPIEFSKILTSDS